MILPTKHIPLGNSLLGLGARVVGHLDRPRTLTAVWEGVRENSEIETFPRLVLALDLLFALGVVEFRDGLIARID